MCILDKKGMGRWADRQQENNGYCSHKEKNITPDVLQ